ncbi:Antigenic heat-stable 120 kDa protein [Quillaja saponaria]|uniref:Antigenic heat-stable 120 kDa protein n=1 Tax=Quillaja saponaria TaxID=32244 RepID=A0AAD7Q1U7_QUISA|nr:Antigenic heat-stable 120 kDa protein [Quillaja saponaria]
MSSSSVITPEDVLESLMNDGTIDALRLKIINQLKANEELKNTSIKMAEQSKVLNTPGAEKQTKRELFDALRQELEAPVLEKASKSVWELILDNNGLGRDISETVERVFCRLSGQEPPLFPLPDGESQPDKETDNVKGKGKQIENENENSKPTSKKRRMSERSEEGINDVATKSSDPVALPEGSSKSPQLVPKA